MPDNDLNNLDFYPISYSGDLFYWFIHAISPMTNKKDLWEG